MITPEHISWLLIAIASLLAMVFLLIWSFRKKSLSITQTLSGELDEERAARERLKLFSLVVEQSTEGVAILDLDGQIIFVNHAFAQMHEYKQSELLGKNLNVFHSEDQLAAVDAANEQLKKNGEFIGEVWHAKKDGTPFLSSMHNTLLRDENGRVMGMIGLMRDITDSKRVEVALRESETTYTAIFNAANDAIFIHDKDNAAILDVNERVTEMYGYSAEEMKGVSVNDISLGESPFSQTEAVRWMQAALEEGPQLFEWLCKNRNGETFWTEVNLKRAIVGGQERVLAVVRDITERKRTGNQLKRYSDNLERMVEERTKQLDVVRADLFSSAKLAAMGRMGAGIAHQLNSPICGGLLLIDSLLESCEAGTENHEKLSVLRRTIAGMKDVIECMLALAMVSRRGEPLRAEVNINDVVRRIMGFEALECQKKSIKVEAMYAKDLPGLEAVTGELDQVFLNLINNAIDSMEEGGMLSIETVDVDGWIEIRVCDTGGGISEMDMDKIFEPFFTTKRKRRGLGLGLSIARETVARYGGKMDVTSRVGEGAQFSVRLPAKRENGKEDS